LFRVIKIKLGLVQLRQNLHKNSFEIINCLPIFALTFVLDLSINGVDQSQELGVESQTLILEVRNFPDINFVKK
jgi:hypothetical protein